MIAQRMDNELTSDGRVPWTTKLTLLPEGIEFVKKTGDEPRVIAYSQITKWEVDQGLLKLAIEGSQKPNIVDKTNQLNFYPGLALFTVLVNAPGRNCPLFEGVHLSN